LPGFFVSALTDPGSPFAEVRRFRPLVSGPKIPVPGAVRLFEMSYAVVAVGFNHGMKAEMHEDAGDASADRH
jgi:hypothetical protein